MKDKLYYNFVNSLLGLGIIALPISVLIYILFEKKIVVTYMNHFNVLVIGAAVCILSFLLHFILTRSYGYKKVMLKYKEENNLKLSITGDIFEGIKVKMGEMGYHLVSLPNLFDLYVQEEPLKDSRLYVKVVALLKEETSRKVLKEAESTLIKYYEDNNINIEAITGVVGVVFEGVTKKQIERYEEARDYFNYNSDKDIVIQIALCAVDIQESLVYFNSDNVTGKRLIPIKMINDIFGEG